MKTYIYYGTEENAFEIEKYETKNPFEDVRDFLNYIDDDEIDTALTQMKSDFEKNGFSIYETEQKQGYEIIIGIAEFGKCSKIKRVMELRRQEIVSMFNF